MTKLYVQLGGADYHMRKEGGHFNRDEFHKFRNLYYSIFKNFMSHADILMAGAFGIKSACAVHRVKTCSHRFQNKVIAMRHHVRYEWLRAQLRKKQAP